MHEHGYTGHIDAAHQGHYISHPETHPVAIEQVTARQILDSRGYPTVSVTLHLHDGMQVSASAPAGASTGAYEAVELRDDGPSYSGRSVHRAVAGVETEISPVLAGRHWTTLRELDDALRALDGTENLTRLGANAVVAVSIAAARAFAHASEVPLHVWLARVTDSAQRLPVPHFNVLNGGAHAANPLEFQEFMIAPVGAADEAAAVEAGAEIYHALAARVKARFHTAGLGDEGGFAPNIASPEEAMELLVQAIQDAGYTPGLNDVAIAIDPAANGFYEREGKYKIAGKLLGRDQLVDYYIKLLDEYPLRSIEDGFAEDDHAGWKLLYDAVGTRTQLVGDDLYVTDPRRISDGARNHYSNAALIKPNQIGTVSSTLDAIATARRFGMQSMVSHRSGETTDSFIADLVVGTGTGQIKSGAPARGERVIKYNRLLEIELDNKSLPYGLELAPTHAPEVALEP
ncbi:phosphopyruvate hydratase [Leifsonia sp. 22587]|uniref:phosphopyruvate hydratase n=1 Tax=Leifsonia sp. 22587 TaxID=3453946 RepID=UPI003F863A3B